MRSLLAEVRYALRALRSEPRFTLAALVTLALGIGITTTMFGVVNGILLRPLPYPAAERLVTICTDYPGSSGWCSISPPNVSDIERRSRTIEAIGIARSNSYYMKVSGGSTVVSGGIATPGVFRALGASVHRGRLFDESDLLGRESDVAVVTHQFWRQELAGDPAVIGRAVVLDDKPVTIVGVLDSGFTIPQLSFVKVWRTVDFRPDDESNRKWAGLVGFARLRPGVPLETARGDLAAIAAQLRREHFTETAGWGLTMNPLEDLVVGTARPVLLAFLASVFLVLLIACFNVANLMLARAAVRARQIAVRVALGASRARIIRAQLVESFILAVVASVAGIWLALWGTTAFAKFAPANIPRLGDVHVDGRVLGFALLLAAATTLVFGLMPAVRSARVDPASAFRDGGRSAGTRTSRVRGVMLISELALTTILVAGAATLVRTFAATAAWEPGFEREHVLTFSLSARPNRYQSRGALAQLWSTAENELRAIPGVVKVGSTSAGPLFGGGDGFAEVVMSGRQTPVGAAAAWYNVSPGYFSALGVPFVRGRDLEEGDTVGGMRPTVVNEAFAKQYLGGADPVGATFVVRLGDSPRSARIIGVVRDIPQITPGEVTAPQMYWSNRAMPRGFTYFVIRASVPPTTLVPAIRERLAAVDQDFAPGNVRAMPELIAARLAVPRFDMMVLMCFAVVALWLAGVGTYALFAYLVSQRRRELGIRLALGAHPAAMARDVFTRALRLAGAGVVLGVIGLLVIARVLRGVMPGLPHLDGPSMAIGASVLMMAAVAAVLQPARRAARVDPIAALKVE